MESKRHHGPWDNVFYLRLLQGITSGLYDVYLPSSCLDNVVNWYCFRLNLWVPLTFLRCVWPMSLGDFANTHKSPGREDMSMEQRKDYCCNRSFLPQTGETNYYFVEDSSTSIPSKHLVTLNLCYRHEVVHTLFRLVLWQTLHVGFLRFFRSWG